MGGLALLLRYLSSWQAIILASGAVAFNVYALPRLAGTLYRPGEIRRRLTSGIVLYPVAVLFLLVAFADRPDVAAAAWGVLAFGDGMATLVGRRVRSAPIPWNREKSIAGSVAFILFGGSAVPLSSLRLTHGFRSPCHGSRR
jgi:dolichol kinase